MGCSANTLSRIRIVVISPTAGVRVKYSWGCVCLILSAIKGGADYYAPSLMPR